MNQEKKEPREVIQRKLELLRGDGKKLIEQIQDDISEDELKNLNNLYSQVEKSLVNELGSC